MKQCRFKKKKKHLYSPILKQHHQDAPRPSDYALLFSSTERCTETVSHCSPFCSSFLIGAPQRNRCATGFDSQPLSENQSQLSVRHWGGSRNYCQGPSPAWPFLARFCLAGFNLPYAENGSQESGLDWVKKSWLDFIQTGPL